MLSSKIWIIAGIIITLALGLTLGILVDRTSYHPHKDWGTKGIYEERLLARLSRKLNLTRPQIQAIGGILRIQAMKIKDTKDEFQNRFREIKEETTEKIKPHLTPEQQERYDKLVESHKKRWGRVCRTERSCRY